MSTESLEHDNDRVAINELTQTLGNLKDMVDSLRNHYRMIAHREQSVNLAKLIVRYEQDIRRTLHARSIVVARYVKRQKQLDKKKTNQDKKAETSEQGQVSEQQ